MKYYDDFLKMLDWTDEQIESQRDRVENMLNKISADSPEAIQHAIDHVNVGFDLSIPGVATLCGLAVEQLVRNVHIKEDFKYFVGLNQPVAPPMILGMLFAAYEAAKAGNNVLHINGVITNCINTLGMIFDKYNAVLEAGELIGQAAGKAHCAYYQAQAGLYDLGIIPVPDMVISSGWFCDQGAETDELIADKFGFETIPLDGCNDYPWDSKPTQREIKYMASTLDRAVARVEELTGLKVTKEHSMKGWEFFNGIATALGEIFVVVGQSDPQCISQGDVGFLYTQSLFPPNLDNAPKQIEAFQKVLAEAKRRVSEEIGILPKGSPRVFCSMRTACDARTIKVIEETGLAVAAMFVDLPYLWDFEPPIVPQEEATSNMMAVEYFFKRPGITDIKSAARYHAYVTKQTNCDGAILGYVFNCRPLCGPIMMYKDHFEKETGKPALVLEMDSYDSRMYSAEQIKTRIESFAEILKLQKNLS